MVIVSDGWRLAFDVLLSNNIYGLRRDEKLHEETDVVNLINKAVN